MQETLFRAISGNSFFSSFPKTKIPSSMPSYFAFFFASFLLVHTHAHTQTLGAHNLFVFWCWLRNTCAEFKYVHAILFYFDVCLFFFQHGDQFSHRFISFAVNLPIDRHSFCGNTAKKRTANIHSKAQLSAHIRSIGETGRDKERVNEVEQENERYALSARKSNTHFERTLKLEK